MERTWSSIRQFFPPKPIFFEKDVPDLSGKVYIVTGANAGLGKELSQILYSKNAKVYMAARSPEKTQKAIESIKAAVPNSTGQMVFIRLDLADLTTIKASVQEFLSKEQRLHALFNNAGVGYPPQGSKSAQGYELQLGVNCVGTFMFTQLLAPTLVCTAKTSPPNTVRVIWVCSSAAEGLSPSDFQGHLSHQHDKSAFEMYSASKMGEYFLATEFAARHKADGVVSTPLNPGALDSEFWRDQSRIMVWLLRRTVLYPSVYGAYTNLWAAFSPDVTIEKTGSFVTAWGRFWKLSKDLLDASKTKAEGGTELAQPFWEWTMEQVKPYL